jgi:hypothetical protein
LVKNILSEEASDIIKRLESSVVEGSMTKDAFLKAKNNYLKALKIAYYWINNYLSLDYRSLGSYTHAQLDEIAADEDAF